MKIQEKENDEEQEEGVDGRSRTNTHSDAAHDSATLGQIRPLPVLHTPGIVSTYRSPTLNKNRISHMLLCYRALNSQFSNTALFIPIQNSTSIYVTMWTC